MSVRKRIEVTVWDNEEISVTETEMENGFSTTHQEPEEALNHIRSLLYISDRKLSKEEKEHAQQIEES